MTISFIYSFPFPFRGAFSYVKRVTEKNGKRDYAAKFVTSRGRRKAAALREMELLSELEHERILYFHDAFEKKNVLVLITELYPSGQTWSTIFCFFITMIQLRQIKKWKKKKKRLHSSGHITVFIVEQKCT